MTDKEIKSAMEACLNRTDRCVCTIEDCPYAWEDECSIDLWKDALDLINRQQAEIERLKAENEKAKNYLAKCFDKYEKTKIAKESLENTVYTARAEAIKEFAEKLKAEIEEALKSNYKARAERMKTADKEDTFVHYCNGKISALDGIDDYIDNLVKEMVGADNG